jgi:hypothetical protein
MVVVLGLSGRGDKDLAALAKEGGDKVTALADGPSPASVGEADRGTGAAR